MTSDKQTYEETVRFKEEFIENGIEIGEIETTDNPPFGGRKSYDILLFDWGGACIGNSNTRHFCRYILDEAIEKPSRIYIMVSTFTADAMKEALDSFEKANGELPANVFLNITDACKLLVA
jgi:hypothetical protein